MENDEEDEFDTQKSKMSWSDLIFLPFHPVFKLLVLYSAVLKCIFGPIQAIYPIIYCSDIMDRNLSSSFIKYSYWYVSDVIYGIDTFLHIVHRQITDKSCQREYLPKSALLLQLDIISLVPFFQLFTSDLCPPVEVFPNILSFTEFIVIYRVMDYFSFLRTHSIWKMVMGFTVLTVITVNCITCFFLLLTENGLCSSCVAGVHDWRVSLHELNTTKNDEFSTYTYGASFVYIYIINIMMEDTIPHTIAGYLLVALFMIFGYGIATFVVFPKIVAESIYRVRSFVDFYPLVQRIISETQRRNPSPLAHVDVENFYTLMWQKRGGVTFTPYVLTQLPRYLRVDIRQDVVWSVFYHSPTLKKTSNSYKRWLCECIHLDYKLPGEKFYSGPHCRTNLYYLKSGIVQLISTDDSTTPLLSVTSGTVFGDISFFLPPLHKKEAAICLTYCEVFYVSRADILKSLYIFPEDRKIILQKTKERINHARTLYTCKQHIRGLDRTEDEGVAWVKRRWWEISDCVSNWKKLNREDMVKCEMPPEEAIYHCSKYIGQLVLCTDSQLQSKSLFSNVSFPWILAPNSKFTVIWNRVVFYTVFLVLIFYPVCITMENIPELFKYFEHWTNIIYPMDIFLSFLTAIERQESMISNSCEIIFARFKSFTFLMDVFATLWIEDLVLIIGKPQLYTICKFNRLIKIYVLFMGAYIKESSGFSINPLFCDLYKVILGYFSLFYISGCLSHTLKNLFSDLTTTSYFVESYCKRFCLLDGDNVYLVVIAWTMLISFFQYPRKSFTDIYYAAVLSFIIFFVAIFSKSRLIAALFVNYRETTNFQCFVTNLNLFYKHHKIHPDLLRRLNRYMLCHWKYYKGMDVMHPNLLKDIPYDIYWKVHGEGAVKLIGSSKAFFDADPALIRELAYKSKFLMLPKHSTINLFGIQSVNVTWLAQGSIKCEYHNDKGELQKFLYPSGQMLSLSSVFLGKTALRTYIAYTDCEVLYLTRKDFFNTIKRFPNEMSYFNYCIEEISQNFHNVYKKYSKKHRLYQQKLHDRVFHARLSNSTEFYFNKNENNTDESDHYHFHFWTDPESRFIQWWLIIRIVFVVINIICASLQGGSGAIYRPRLKIVSAGCDCISIIDIILKCFLCYYDEKGLLISDIRKCTLHYITRGFAMDLIGALPWYGFINEVLTSPLEEEHLLILNTMCKFAHLYLLLGYFNYIADKPSINMGYMMILKWQIFILLIMFGASQYFVSECINFSWDEFSNVIDMERKNSCWLPNHMPINVNPTEKQLHLVFAHSLSFSQSGIVKVNLGKYNLDFHNVIIIIIIFILEIAFWFVMCYSVTLVMLATRGSRLYQHGVGKVKKFLESERAEKEVIERAVAHFGYWWQRTKGINIQSLMNERIGAVFRQDLGFYFYRTTFAAFDTLINGGETLQRRLAGTVILSYFLPNEPIMREMDLFPWVYIVHRGKVTISQNGIKIATLTKGAVFGQINGTKSYPIRVTATADAHVDILEISAKVFQDIIDDDAKKKITDNPQSKSDFMALKRPVVENSYNTVEFIMRGKRSLKLPWMVNAVTADSGIWYRRWLTLVWLIAPVGSAFEVLVYNTLPFEVFSEIYWFFVIGDLIHFAYFISEFYTLELIVVHNKCIYRPYLWRKFQYWGVYADLLSLLLPCLTFVTKNMLYQLARLVRLRLLYDYHRHFCESFKAKITSAFIKIILIILALHALTCGWMRFACGEWSEEFPVPIVDGSKYNITEMNTGDWSSILERKAGCAVYVFTKDKNNTILDRTFIVPKNWHYDYIVAMTYIILIQTSTNMNKIFPLTVPQIYYKIFVTFCIYIITIWLTSLAISSMFLRFRELYKFDYNVLRLEKYLSNCGLSPILLKTMKDYSNCLWDRQKGNWIPELIAQQSPLCLREDILGALYMHHLDAPPLFRHLPAYFKRQLVVKLRRIVMFPGKYIIQMGDIFPCIYFVHEGEVERWQTDLSGNKKMVSLLSINGYFGLIPGLFPNTPHPYSYFTRTVVDLVYLRYKEWQDLLDGYPEVKANMYAEAKQLKKDIGLGDAV